MGASQAELNVREQEESEKGVTFTIPTTAWGRRLVRDRIDTGPARKLARNERDFKRGDIERQEIEGGGEHVPGKGGETL